MSFRWPDLDQALSVRELGLAKADIPVFEKLSRAVLESKVVSFDYLELTASKPERRWHPSQEVKELKGKDRSVELTFEIASFEEITRWVLSWGGQAEVIAPKKLRERVAEEIEIDELNPAQAPSGETAPIGVSYAQ